MTTGAGQAGDDYNTNGTQVQGLDERLTQEINDAVAQNQQARDKIKSILSEMKIVQASLAGKSDPLALSEYQKYLDQQLAAVQRVLDDAQVNTKAKQQILTDIAAEYKATGPTTPPPKLSPQPYQHSLTSSGPVSNTISRKPPTCSTSRRKKNNQTTERLASNLGS